MTRPALERLLRSIAPTIKTFVTKSTGDVEQRLLARIAALETQMDVLKAPPRLVYEGVCLDSKAYAPGAAVTHDGSVFIALTASIGVRPGRGGPWQLAVKHGRDAR